MADKTRAVQAAKKARDERKAKGDGGGRRHNSDFADVLAGPHYWISVETKDGRVVRIPVEGRRRAAGKRKASKATVRPFQGTQGRDVQYKAKGQGGAAARPSVRAQADAARAAKGSVSERAKRILEKSQANRQKAVDRAFSSRAAYHRAAQDGTSSTDTVASLRATAIKAESRQEMRIRRQDSVRKAVGRQLAAQPSPARTRGQLLRARYARLPDGGRYETQQLLNSRNARAAALRAQRAARSTPTPTPAASAPVRATTASGTLREQAAARRAAKAKLKTRDGNMAAAMSDGSTYTVPAKLVSAGDRTAFGLTREGKDYRITDYRSGVAFGTAYGAKKEEVMRAMRLLSKRKAYTDELTGQMGDKAARDARRVMRALRNIGRPRLG